jgi:alanine racemase
VANTWTELDLETLSENIAAVRSALRGSTRVIFVVKSNAYGHGLQPVSVRAWDCGVRWFAVARVDEALALRRILPEAEILMVGVLDPADAALACEHNVIAVLVNERQASSLASEMDGRGKVLRCHAKIDTGMGRLGFRWDDAAAKLTSLARHRGLDIQGACSHFASPQTGSGTPAEVQFERFNQVVRDCEAKGMELRLRHMSSSGALLRHAAWDMDGVRPGILLYGYGSAPDTRNEREAGEAGGPEALGIRTRPFLEWKTRVVQIKHVRAGSPIGYDGTHVTSRDTHIGTLDVGYADGYSRHLSNKAVVLAGARRAPIVGRVTMNFVTVDLGPETTVKEGDEVVLLGQQGSEAIWADEIATRGGTISYEILTGIRTEDRRLRA